MRAATAVAMGALLLSACRPEGEAPRRARLESQRAHLEASLERLEARLLEGQARVRAWEELRERHARVAAIACEVNVRHVGDMARLEEEERWHAAGLAAPRLAGGPALLGRGGGQAPPPEAPQAGETPVLVPPAALPGTGGN